MSAQFRSERRILIAGGAGFLGSHLVDRMLNAGHSVICLDDFTSGAMENISQHLSNPKFRLIRHDVCDPIHLEADEIWNLACPASPKWYQDDPVKTTRTSVLGALNLLELAKSLDCPIFQASTSEIYGDAKIHPQNEDYWGNVNPIGIRACYDEGKRCAETLFFDYHRQHGVKIKIARIFNTYGQRMQTDDGRVISNFVVQALKGADITIYGDGQQTRSFCHVDDTIEACIRLMNTGDEVTGPVNIGSPLELSIRSIAEQIVEATRSRSAIVLRPLPVDDPRRRCPDISLAMSLLKWEPKIAFEEGLKATISYYRMKLDIPEEVSA